MQPAGLEAYSCGSWMAFGHPAYLTVRFWENQRSTTALVLNSSIGGPSLLILISASTVVGSKQLRTSLFMRLTALMVLSHWALLTGSKPKRQKPWLSFFRHRGHVIDNVNLHSSDAWFKLTFIQTLHWPRVNFLLISIPITMNFDPDHDKFRSRDDRMSKFSRSRKCELLWNRFSRNLEHW